MPGPDGLEVLGAISAKPQLADVRVIIVTTFEIDRYVVEALQVRDAVHLVGEPPTVNFKLIERTGTPTP